MLLVPGLVAPRGWPQAMPCWRSGSGLELPGVPEGGPRDMSKDLRNRRARPAAIWRFHGADDTGPSSSMPLIWPRRGA